MQTQQPQQNPWAINMAQRRQVLQQSVKRRQLIDSQTFNPSNGNNLYTCNKILAAGLLLRFYAEVTATFAVVPAATATAATDFGAANLVKTMTFTDLQSNQRHNCSGLQLVLTQSFKDKHPFLGAVDYSQSTAKFGANWNLAYATAPTTAVTGTARCVYEIPLAYNDDDLRGSIYANVVSNQMNFQLEINNNAAPITGDDTFAVFFGTGASSITSVTINVYQEYLDNLPVAQNGAIVLPQIDTSTLYQLLATNFTNITAGQENFVQYTNFRRFMSLITLYNSTGAAGGRLVGSDIQTWKLVSANLTSIFQESPLMRALIQRRILGTDPPPGTYYFPSRNKPIYTQASGNMQLDLIPLVAGSNAYLYVMWEFFGQQNTLTQAGSLPASN